VVGIIVKTAENLSFRIIYESEDRRVKTSKREATEDDLEKRKKRETNSKDIAYLSLHRPEL
jgi:hypothetical protein